MCSSSAAGRPGLSAALTAGRAGARVILCDEDFVLGGRLNSERREIDGDERRRTGRGRRSAELASLPEVRILRRTSVFGVYDGGIYGAIERVSDHLPVPAAHQPRQRYWKIVAKRVVLAAGAIERPIVFGGNDRPGVMMASAVRTYLNRFGVTPGQRVAVLFTTTDDGWNTAFDLAAAGVEVEAIVDPRADSRIRRCWPRQTASARGVLPGMRRCSRRTAGAAHGHHDRSSQFADGDGHSMIRLSADTARGLGRLEPEPRPVHAPRRASALDRAARRIRAGR